MTAVRFKVWKAGTNTLVITIPKWLRKLENIEEHDCLDIDLTAVYHIPKNNKEKTKNCLKDEVK